MAPTRTAAQRRRAQILAAARRRMVGTVSSVTIEEIADELGIARRTVYRYFPTRDHLSLAVQHDILQQWTALVLERSEATVGTGLARVSALFALFGEQSDDWAEEIRFTRAFESTPLGQRPPEGELATAFRAVHERLLGHVAALLRLGAADGSVVAVADAEVTAATLMNGYLALAQQVYVRIPSLSEHDRAFAKSTLSEQARLFVRALSA